MLRWLLLRHTCNAGAVSCGFLLPRLLRCARGLCQWHLLPRWSVCPSGVCSGLLLCDSGVTGSVSCGLLLSLFLFRAHRVRRRKFLQHKRPLGARGVSRLLLLRGRTAQHALPCGLLLSFFERSSTGLRAGELLRGWRLGGCGVSRLVLLRHAG